MFALLARPEKLIAFEIDPQRVDALDRFVERHALVDVVKVHYGVDQTDGHTVRRLVAEEVGDAPLDFVVDDASHLYGPTLSSFLTLFPLLRPGGEYVIEDWSADHSTANLLERALADPECVEHGWALDAVRGSGGVDRSGQLSSTDVARSGIHGAEQPPVVPPLSRLVLELALAVAEGVPGIAQVLLDGHVARVVRDEAGGDEVLVQSSHWLRDRFGLLRA